MVAAGGREFDAGDRIRHGLAEAVGEEITEAEEVLELGIHFPTAQTTEERGFDEHGSAIQRLGDLAKKRVGSEDGSGAGCQLIEEGSTGNGHG